MPLKVGDIVKHNLSGEILRILKVSECLAVCQHPPYSYKLGWTWSEGDRYICQIDNLESGNGCGPNLATEVKGWPTISATESSKSWSGDHQNSLSRMAANGLLAGPGEPQYQWESPRTVITEEAASLLGGYGKKYPESFSQEQINQVAFDGFTGTVKPSLGLSAHGYHFREDVLRALGNSVYADTAELAFKDLIRKFGIE